MNVACAKPGCAAVPTQREDVRDARGIFAVTTKSKEQLRSYVLCERHDRDYFGDRRNSDGGTWLTAERSERIKRELIPYAPAGGSSA